MNTLQQAALESLLDRPLSIDEKISIDVHLPDRNDIQIAKLLPYKKKIVSTPIGIGTILAVLAPYGGDFLNALELIGQTDSNVKWALKLIEQSNFDIGMQSTRDQMIAFKGAAPSLADSIMKLLEVAEKLEPISYNEVSDVLNIAEGRLVL